MDHTGRLLGVYSFVALFFFFTNSDTFEVHLRFDAKDLCHRVSLSRRILVSHTFDVYM